jgi:hypothetical protein
MMSSTNNLPMTFDGFDGFETFGWVGGGWRDCFEGVSFYGVRCVGVICVSVGMLSRWTGT